MNAFIKIMAHGARLPEYAKPGDSGADLRWYEDTIAKLVIDPNKTALLWTGIGIQLPAGFEAQIRPRSSLSAKGIWCAFGTVDSGYRGQLGIALTNTTREAFLVERGDRIAQLVIAPVVQAQFMQVDSLESSARGDTGFGSSGVK